VLRLPSGSALSAFRAPWRKAGWSPPLGCSSLMLYILSHLSLWWAPSPKAQRSDRADPEAPARRSTVPPKCRSSPADSDRLPGHRGPGRAARAACRDESTAPAMKSCTRRLSGWSCRFVRKSRSSGLEAGRLTPLDHLVRDKSRPVVKGDAAMPFNPDPAWAQTPRKTVVTLLIGGGSKRGRSNWPGVTLAKSTRCSRRIS
jgi:hypothetical protein